jgi:hypothetical protein
LPSVLIPFPAAADDHQRSNARAFADSGAARMLDQHSATTEAFLACLHTLVEDSEARREMQLALEKWDAPQAAETIAAAILNALSERSESRTAVPRGSANAEPAKTRALSFGIWGLVLFWSCELGPWFFVP